MARKPVSAATKLKIARSLKGNKNAFKGGPKKGLSTREKIANINAATKAKKANLSSDQIARRQAVAKRLRAQARREEALGGGNPGEMKTNADAISQTLAQSDRLKAGGLEAMKSAKSADDMRAATAKIKEARAALKEAMPRSSRKESQAKVQPKAKQNLNAPQAPTEQRSAALSPAQRRRQQASSFEANQAKARASTVQTDSKGNIVQRAGGNSTTADVLKAYEQKRQSTSGVKSNSGDNAVAPGNRKPKSSGDTFDNHYNKAEQKVVNRIDDLKQEISRMEAHRGSNSLPGPAEKRAKNALETARNRLSRLRYERSQNNTPKPPQSDTGSDRSGTFTKEVPVKGEKATRPAGRKAVETDNDRALREFTERMETMTEKEAAGWVKHFGKSIPRDELERMAREVGAELEDFGL